MFRQMVKAVLVVVFMTIPVLSGCSDNGTSPRPQVQTVTPVPTAVAATVTTTASATAIVTATPTTTAVGTAFNPDGVEGCQRNGEFVGRNLRVIAYDTHLCILAGIPGTTLEKVTHVLLYNPTSFSERNLWIEEAGKFLKALGRDICPNDDGSGTSYLAMVTSGPLFDQFQATGNPTKAVQTSSSSVKAPSSCTGVGK